MAASARRSSSTLQICDKEFGRLVSVDSKSRIGFRTFVEMLKDSDPDKRYPLPVNIMWVPLSITKLLSLSTSRAYSCVFDEHPARWAWNQVPKDESDVVKLGARQQVIHTLAEFTRHTDTHDVVSLVKEFSRGRPGGLDPHSLQLLLTVLPPGRPHRPPNIRALVCPP